MNILLQTRYLATLALAILFTSSSSAFELHISYQYLKIQYLPYLETKKISLPSKLNQFQARDRTPVEGNFASTAMSSDSVMMTSDTGSTTASRIIVNVSQSATTTPHGPTATGSTSAAASATPPSGQNRAIGFSVSQFAVGVGAVAGFMAFNML
jgi:hypothetical protein